MTPEAIALRGFLVLVALAGVGVVCCGMRAYSRDRFRQDAFAIRDELFDYAAGGHVSFSHPAYWRLRLMMNAVIQYSHRLTFGEALLPLIIDTLYGRHHQQPSHHRAWAKAKDDLPREVREHLEGVNRRFNVLLISHLVANTPLSWPLLIGIAGMYGLRAGIRKLAEKAPDIEADAFREADIDPANGYATAA